MTRRPGRPRTITVLTTGRQDWGILRSVVRRPSATTPALGSISSPAACTSRPATVGPIDLVRADGFEPDAELDWVGGDATTRRPTTRPAAALAAVGAHLRAARPDALVIVGDRFETAAAALAATARAGADRPPARRRTDARARSTMPLRHAITKLAHLHLVSDEATPRG